MLRNKSKLIYIHFRLDKQQRSRNPTANQAAANLDLIDPVEYLDLNRNGNTRRNAEMALRTYERIMSSLSERSGEVFEPLKEASLGRLPYLLMKFLQSAKKPDGTVYASGTINTNFNGICNLLSSRENEPVNVKSDARFKRVLEMLKVQTTLSATAGRGSGCEAKRPVSKEHLGLALNAGTIGRKAPKPLVTSVYLGSVLGWGCRAGAEVHMIQNQDLVYGPINQKTGVNDWIELSERVTKTRTGNPGDERELVPRIFPDDEFPETCYVRTVLEYQRRKTPAQRASEAPFFLNVHPAATKKPQQYQFWYVGSGKAGSGIMGVNMLERLVTDALETAGIDCKLHKYSAISLRKSMLQSGVDCNVPDLHLSRLAGHKALVSKKAYVNSAGLHHKTTGRVIHRQLFHGLNRGYEKEMRDVDVEGRSEEEGPGVTCSRRTSPAGKIGRYDQKKDEIRMKRSRSGDRGRREKLVARSSSSSGDRMEYRREKRSPIRKGRHIWDRSRSRERRGKRASRSRSFERKIEGERIMNRSGGRARRKRSEDDRRSGTRRDRSSSYKKKRRYHVSYEEKRTGRSSRNWDRKRRRSSSRSSSGGRRGKKLSENRKERSSGERRGGYSTGFSRRRSSSGDQRGRTLSEDRRGRTSAGCRRIRSSSSNRRGSTSEEDMERRTSTVCRRGRSSSRDRRGRKSSSDRRGRNRSNRRERSSTGDKRGRASYEDTRGRKLMGNKMLKRQNLEDKRELEKTDLFTSPLAGPSNQNMNPPFSAEPKLPDGKENSVEQYCKV